MRGKLVIVPVWFGVRLLQRNTFNMWRALLLTTCLSETVPISKNFCRIWMKVLHILFWWSFTPISLLWWWTDSWAMSRKVVQVQPRSRVKEAGQWTTGLCECYKDMGDCKYTIRNKTTVWSLHLIHKEEKNWTYVESISYYRMSWCCEVIEHVYLSVAAGCFALCCLPVFTCKVTSAAGACPCLPLLDCISCVPPASLAMRASVRERYGIQVM